jgi:hypothetical protein
LSLLRCPQTRRSQRKGRTSPQAPRLSSSWSCGGHAHRSGGRVVGIVNRVRRVLSIRIIIRNRTHEHTQSASYPHPTHVRLTRDHCMAQHAKTHALAQNSNAGADAGANPNRVRAWRVAAWRVRFGMLQGTWNLELGTWLELGTCPGADGFATKPDRVQSHIPGLWGHPQWHLGYR